ncbi:hypothetical protein AB0K60_32640, partial [Thermopolyspora sp. NPDC052614]|uniref:hypothetical protein n=1 Tax=Thermopolyspora sp. NPDC052614 TaxID=3155682 RepID=UPI00343FDC1B
MTTTGQARTDPKEARPCHNVPRAVQATGVPTDKPPNGAKPARSADPMTTIGQGRTDHKEAR